jgi:hypothetical protein
MFGSAAATLGTPPVFALLSTAGLAVALWAWCAPAPGPSSIKRPFAETFTTVLRPELATGLLFIGLSPLLFGALAFGATNFAWASGYAAGACLGDLLAGLGGDVLSYLSLAAVCLLALLLIQQKVQP